MISPERIEDIQGQAFVCAPARFANVGFVYPLTMTEILTMGYMDYNKKLGLLLLSEVKIQNLIKEKSQQDFPIEEIYPLSFLLQNASVNDSFFLELKDCFSTFLKEDVLLLPDYNAILIDPKHPEQKRLITNENFSEFQDILRIQNRREVQAEIPKDESPAQRKMRLLREKVAAAKKKQAAKNNEQSSIINLLEMATVFGIDLDKCSYFAFQGLLLKYQAQEKYHCDIQMLCAGAEAEKLKIKYWGESSKN